MHLRIGTRGSALARWQADHVASLLREAGATTEIVVLSTSGDRVLDTPLPLIGGKGVFTQELESALREGRIDVAVHSLKDLPTDDSPGLPVGAVTARADPRDALIVRGAKAAGLAGLPHGAVVGTSSTRRIAQLRRRRPDVQIRDIRGNVDTRVRKCTERGEYDAIVLACAGLDRLGMSGVITARLESHDMLPAPGQAAVGVQCGTAGESLALLRKINHLATELCVTAERTVLAELGGGCSLPIAALATLEGGAGGETMKLRARVTSPDSATEIDVELTDRVADSDGAKRLGKRAATELKQKGAATLLRMGPRVSASHVDPP